VNLGFFITAQHPRSVSPRVALRQHLEQVELARELGFDSALLGQHFLPEPYWMFQTVPLLARLAAEAGDMRLGTGILLLTLLNPVEVAEHVATLAELCDGGFVCGVGHGYRKVEDAAFGVTGGREALFSAKLRTLRMLLRGETVTSSGPGFELDGAKLATNPRVDVPIWVAANRDSGVRRAAQDGDAWLINPHASLPELERQIALYREHRESVGLPLASGLPITREVCIRTTDAEAERVARPYILEKYASYIAWGQEATMPAGDTLRGDWPTLRANDRFIIGSPETCVARIREYERRLGVTDMICRVQWPGMPQNEVRRSLELLGKHVIPAFRQS
jgi:alkanesulfonate monooxygenase SsuD/methylene tetrahydromethanopterin reductase-like flavin-dependent oxidoreductase (luciferase family)